MNGARRKWSSQCGQKSMNAVDLLFINRLQITAKSLRRIALPYCTGDLFSVDSIVGSSVDSFQLISIVVRQLRPAISFCRCFFSRCRSLDRRAVPLLHCTIRRHSYAQGVTPPYNLCYNQHFRFLSPLPCSSSDMTSCDPDACVRGRVFVRRLDDGWLT